MVRFIRKNTKPKPRRNIITSQRRVSSTDYYRPQNKPVNSVSTESKLDTKKRKFTISTVINYLLAAVIVGLLLFSTTLSADVDIRVAASDFSYRNKAEYAVVAEEILASSITNRSKLLFRSKNFEQQMIDRFPEVRLIDAILPIAGRSLTVSIRVADPLAKVSSGGQNGVLDSSGVLVSTGNDNSASLLSLRFTSPQTNFSEGSRLITTDEVYLLQLINNELPQIELKGIEALKINEVLFNVAQGQLEVKVTGVDFFLKLSSYGDPDEQVGAVKATLRQLDREGALPKKYLDVRVPGRAFVL